METNRVNEWMQSCRIEVLIDFIHIDRYGRFDATENLKSSTEHILRRFPWITKEGRRSSPARIVVEIVNYPQGNFRLILSDRLKASQLHAFNLYLASIADRLAELNLKRVESIEFELHVIGGKIASSTK
ncbi:MAG: hypothetical protein AAB582_03765 [Patescibacteria group bacterium]